MSVPRIVLASGSPRRRELLGNAGFAFEVDVPDVEELIAPGEDAVAATSRLAMEKAEAVLARRAGGGGELILAADTTVVLGDRILGKPSSRVEAVEMLLALSGRNHLVLTGWAVLRSGSPSTMGECGICRSVVRMREVARSEAEAYAAGGEPMDKAGAYAAQGEGRRFIGCIRGPLDNVIGLPMQPVLAALSRAGARPS